MDIQPETHSTYFAVGATRPQVPDMHLARPPQPTVPPVMFTPSRRASVEASVSHDTSFRARSLPSARNIRSSRSATSWRSFGGQRTTPLHGSRSRLGQSVDKAWNTKTYDNKAETARRAGPTDRPVHPPWLSYECNQTGATVQTERVRPLLDVTTRPPRALSSQSLGLTYSLHSHIRDQIPKCPSSAGELS